MALEPIHVLYWYLDPSGHLLFSCCTFTHQVGPLLRILPSLLRVCYKNAPSSIMVHT